MPPKSENSFGGEPWIQKEPSGSKRAVVFVRWLNVVSAVSESSKNKLTPNRKDAKLSIATSQSGNDCRCRMIFWIADDRHSSAVGSYHVSFRDSVGRVVGAFGVNVWLERE